MDNHVVIKCFNQLMDVPVDRCLKNNVLGLHKTSAYYSIVSSGRTSLSSNCLEIITFADL
jgi:hypothetical protein